MQASTVLVERDGRVGVVTLNQPDKLNALGEQMRRALVESLREFAADPEVRCVVLTGAGERAFSAGGDVSEMTAPDSGLAGGAEGKEPVEAAIAALQRGHEASWLLHTMPKPTLAAINGAVAGMSLSLAAACDLRIAAEHAVFTSAFARIGFSGDYGGSFFLTQILGTAKARELYFLSDRIDAAEALRIGLVNRVVPKKRFREEARALAQRLADGPPLAYRYMKRNLNLALQMHARELLDLEAEAMIRTGTTQDFREGAQAFLDKRTPRFRGR